MIGFCVLTKMISSLLLVLRVVFQVILKKNLLLSLVPSSSDRLWWVCFAKQNIDPLLADL